MERMNIEGNATPEMVIVIRAESSALQGRHELDMLADNVFTAILTAITAMEEDESEEFEFELCYVCDFIKHLAKSGNASKALHVLMGLSRIAYTDKGIADILERIECYEDGTQIFLDCYIEAAGRFCDEEEE